MPRAFRRCGRILILRLIVDRGLGKHHSKSWRSHKLEEHADSDTCSGLNISTKHLSNISSGPILPHRPVSDGMRTLSPTANELLQYVCVGKVPMKVGPRDSFAVNP